MGQAWQVDPQALLVALVIEDGVFSMGGPLVRLPYWEGLLEPVKRGVSIHDLPGAVEPLLVDAHRRLSRELESLLQVIVAKRDHPL